MNTPQPVAIKRPSEEVIDAVVPPHELDELPISDALQVRNIEHAEAPNGIRIKRTGLHRTALVVAHKYYDGSGGGEPGHYVQVYVEFDAADSRWRTIGVRVRAVEAARLARDLRANKPSKPGRREPPRIGGAVVQNEDALLGQPLRARAGYLVYLKHKAQNAQWKRTRGVEIRPSEVAAVAKELAKLAARCTK